MRASLFINSLFGDGSINILTPYFVILLPYICKFSSNFQLPFIRNLHPSLVNKFLSEISNNLLKLRVFKIFQSAFIRLEHSSFPRLFYPKFYLIYLGLGFSNESILFWSIVYTLWGQYSKLLNNFLNTKVEGYDIFGRVCLH